LPEDFFFPFDGNCAGFESSTVEMSVIKFVIIVSGRIMVRANSLGGRPF